MGRNVAILFIAFCLLGSFSQVSLPDVLKPYLWGLPIDQNFDEILKAADSLESQPTNLSYAERHFSGYLPYNSGFDHPVDKYQLEISKDEYWLTRKIDSNVFESYLYSDSVIFVNLYANYLKKDSVTATEQFWILHKSVAKLFSKIDSIYLLPEGESGHAYYEQEGDTVPTFVLTENKYGAFYNNLALEHKRINR